MNKEKNKYVRCGECRYAKQISLSPTSGLRHYICQCATAPVEYRDGNCRLSGGDMCKAGVKIDKPWDRRKPTAGCLYD